MPSRMSTVLGLIALLGSVALIAWHPAVPSAEGRLVIPIPPGYSDVWRSPYYYFPSYGRSAVESALQGLWSRALLRRLPDGRVVGDLAESWKKSQTTYVLINPKGKLPDGRPYSLAAVKGYLGRLGGRENEFLKTLKGVEEIADRGGTVLTAIWRRGDPEPGDKMGQRLLDRPDEQFHLLKLEIEGWDLEAASRLREVLGTDLAPSEGGGSPSPVTTSKYLFGFSLATRCLSDGTRIQHDARIESGVRAFPTDPQSFPDEAFRKGSLNFSGTDSRGFPLTCGPCRFVHLLPNGGLHLERLADAPETDLPPDLLLPARQDLPLGGTRPLPEFATLVEVPPTAWPAPGMAANREEPGAIRRPGRETIAVIFDATARLLEEPEIRRGLAGSIRRGHLLQEVYRGRGRLVDSIVDPADVALESLPPIAGLDDPVAAGKAFGEAGFARTDSLPGARLVRNGVPLAVEIVVADDRPDLAAVAAQVARDWMSAGVHVRLVADGAVPRRWAGPKGVPRAFVRSINVDATPEESWGNTPKMRPGWIRRWLARAFAEEIAGVPLCRPDREFRIVPAPAETTPLNDRLAEVIDALPPPAPATDGARDPLPPFLR